jgi:hypothetical protein
MWWHRFINRDDAFSRQVYKDGQIQYFARQQQLTESLFDLHLLGVHTMGLPAVNGEGQAAGFYSTATKTMIRWIASIARYSNMDGLQIAKARGKVEPVTYGYSSRSR